MDGTVLQRAHPGRPPVQHGRASLRIRPTDRAATRIRPAPAEALAGSLAALSLWRPDAHALRVGVDASSLDEPAFDFARWRAALARLPHVAISHQRRRPVREVS